MYHSILITLFSLSLLACNHVNSDPMNHESNKSAPPPPDASEGVVDADNGPIAAELIAEPEEIDASGRVALRVANRGERTLNYGRPIRVERWDGNTWRETEESLNAAWTMELLIVQPGETGVPQPWPFLPDQEAGPGWYRFTKELYAETSSGDATRLLIRTRVRVTE
jgi:hypothetical protein